MVKWGLAYTVCQVHSLDMLKMLARSSRGFLKFPSCCNGWPEYKTDSALVCCHKSLAEISRDKAWADFLLSYTCLFQTPSLEIVGLLADGTAYVAGSSGLIALSSRWTLSSNQPTKFRYKLTNSFCSQAQHTKLSFFGYQQSTSTGHHSSWDVLWADEEKEFYRLA